MTETTIPDNSYDARAEASPARKPAAKQGGAGIGHNSAAVEEMSRAETFSSEIASIDREIRTLGDLQVDAQRSLLPSTYAALALLFALLIKVTSEFTLTTFCELMGIHVHGNAKNLVQPIIAWFWRNNEDDYVRQTVWRWASVLALALEAKITVDEFPGWLKARGIERLVSEYQQSVARSKSATDSFEEALADSICARGNDAPVLPATRATEKKLGRRLAVIDVLSTGEFQVLAVLPTSPEQIRKMLAGEARKRSSRGA